MFSSPLTSSSTLLSAATSFSTSSATLFRTPIFSRGVKENGVESGKKKRARTRRRTERILPGVQRGRQEVGEIKHLFKWQPHFVARLARIPSSTYTHLIYVLSSTTFSRVWNACKCLRACFNIRSCIHVKCFCVEKYSNTGWRESCRWTIVDIRVFVRFRGVGVDITATRREKEISLVVFNPIFIALLLPFPRRNDIVWSFIVIVRQQACKWFENKSKVNVNTRGWTFQSSLEKKKKKKWFATGEEVYELWINSLFLRTFCVVILHWL